MSGGSYDYAFRHIDDMAEQLRTTTPLRKAFRTLLVKVAKACHEIEWVDSGDCSPGDENTAIRACLGKDVGKLVLAEAVAEAQKAHAELGKAIEEAKAT